MKVYIISDDFSNSISASNMIGATGNGSIISETKSSDVRDLLSDLKNNVDSGFDLILMMCHSAKDVGISANKLGGVRAVVCKDMEDALEAISNTRANVVLIDSNKVDRRNLESIIQGLTQAEAEARQPAAPSRREAPSRAQQMPRQAPQQYAPPAPKGPSMFDKMKNMGGKVTSSMNRGKDMQPTGKPMAKSAKAGPKSKLGEDAEEFKRTAKSKGMLKALKESLGLEDQ